ncbi:hypothetical protein M407DRAFT_167040 [Tulasnella calospora MUT 4182]|uniref:Uncharacterized protein n=1 Tax=Tulasnella calospora MUT 4182 TaxID=1051891 RepID=A0A0C3L6R7_9AGAM|nr:hypothetical protein M407DRAFT_167040 [Tulasnella calospora MUT 4182]
MNTSAGLAVDTPLPLAASVSVSSPIDVITQASSLQPPISPFAFYMPPSASTAALSASILQGPSSSTTTSGSSVASPAHNNDMQRQRQVGGQGGVASPSTPASDLTPGSLPAASSRTRISSFSSPSDSSSISPAAHVFLTPSLPSHLQSAGFHNTSSNNTASPSSSSSATSGSSPPTSAASSTAAARKQLLLQTAGLSGVRRGSIGPPSSATTSGLPTSMPSTPTSAINSLPGSPAARMHVMDNSEGKKANATRPTLSMGGMSAASRKKRPTSSSLSMSVPGPEPTTAVQHHQALAAATSFHANALFTPPISPGDAQQHQQHQGMYPPPNWPLSFAGSTHALASLQHRSSVLSATSSSAGSDPGFHHPPTTRSDSLEFGSLSAMGDPSGQSFTQQMHSPIDMSPYSSNPLYTSPIDTQLPYTFNNNSSTSSSAPPSHALPPSLRMSSVIDSSLSSLSTSSSTTTLKPQGDMSIFRRGSVNSPGGLSDIIADDFFAASTNFGAGGGGGGSVFNSTNSASPSPHMGTTHSAAPSPNMGHSRQASLTDASTPHHQRMESLTRKMMALGLRREEAEARARQATSALPETFTPTPPDEDFGEFNVLREMVQNGRVSIDDAIARVTASTILKTEVLSPTAGTPLGTVKEEDEPRFEPGVMFAKKKELGEGDAERGRTGGKGKPTKKIIGFGPGAGDDDAEEFSNGLMDVDWRNVSRSRSRMGMDMEWRTGSRSRSRPPAPGTSVNPWDHASEAHSHSLLLQDSDGFTMNGLDSNGFNGAIDIKNSRSPIPIRRPGPSGLQQQQQQSQPSTASSYLDNLPSFQLPPPETRGRAHTTSTMPPPTSLGNFNFHPSSVPVSALYGAPMMQRHAYPKHVRKTSFDHTVSRVGIMSDIGGRHQVNGRPVPPETSLVS